MKLINKIVSTLLIVMAIISIIYLVWYGFCGTKIKITEENFNKYMSLSYEFVNQNKQAGGVAINIKPKSDNSCEYTNLSIGVKVYTQYSFYGLSDDYQYVEWIDIDNNGEGKLNYLHLNGYLDIYGNIDFMAQSALEYKWIGQKVELFGVHYRE